MGIRFIINIFKNISMFFLRCREKSLVWRLGFFLNKNKKFLNSRTQEVSITAEVDSKKEYLNESLKKLLKEWKNDSSKILEYIEKNDTRVISLKNSKKVLKILGEEIGLVLPAKGIKGFKINLLLFKRIGFNSPCVFVVDKEKTDIYILIQQFHKWYFMKNGFSGYEPKSVSLLRKISSKKNSDEISGLNNEEITLLRQAIARDVESITFTEDYARETDGSKEALERIKKNGGTVI